MILDFVKSEKNIADPLTKGLSRSVVLDSSREMGLSPLKRSLTVGTQPLFGDVVPMSVQCGRNKLDK